MFDFLAMRHVGSQLHDQGLNPTPPAFGGKVLTTGLAWKSPKHVLNVPIGLFPDGPVVKNLPTNAGDMGSIPVQEDPPCYRATTPVRHNY